MCTQQHNKVRLQPIPAVFKFDLDLDFVLEYYTGENSIDAFTPNWHPAI